ncbi:protein-L-isoaspartate O-methyltransferase [Candidatus Woesearchaeota archaeon CG10_big_fil_rev_8_21_14_0_10_34_8]|nr:MAG: protein-L-isoaspartate O-methyltransferase [Candidatus Woesearchaeota archaeon CG10_big_fil_rev_8_21_14_0_10_34_8]
MNSDYFNKMGNEDLVDLVRVNPKYLAQKAPRDERVLAALQEVDRKDFLPAESRVLAYYDAPLDIGKDQTCSEPSTVAFMEDVLELEEGMSVLEIGAGCGYHAAVTSHLIGPQGYLTSIEYIYTLAEMARRNLKRHFIYDCDKRLEVVCGDGSVGYAANAPYDRIYLACGVRLDRFDANILTRQLNPEKGILLFPEKEGRMRRLTFQAGVLTETTNYGETFFVPLVGVNSHNPPLLRN